MSKTQEQRERLILKAYQGTTLLFSATMGEDATVKDVEEWGRELTKRGYAVCWKRVPWYRDEPPPKAITLTARSSSGAVVMREDISRLTKAKREDLRWELVRRGLSVRITGDDAVELDVDLPGKGVTP